MKSLIHSYLPALLLVFASAVSSCNKEVAEPLQPQSAAQTSAEKGGSSGTATFKSGDYIVQFQNDPALQLNTNQDIENLANSIAGTQLVFTDIYNFEGFKGFTGYLTKQQARKFADDGRVMVIEPDSPIGPL